MTTNRLAAPNYYEARIIPPKDKAERQAFWIAHGNDSLAQKGMHGLQWVCVNDSYSIVSRR